MTFQLLSTIDIMLALYEKPRSIERFQEYLKTLQGNTKADVAIPIGGFNPMAKEFAVGRLNELKELKAEAIIQETLVELNKMLIDKNDNAVFKIALNLSDDLKGGWTNRYTSDYDSKFKINAMVNRKFCAPVFWTSEPFTETLIKERTQEYAFRTIYWLSHPKPKTLRDHIEQERFVASRVNYEKKSTLKNYDAVNRFFQGHQDSDNYHIIFNFFYGDEASESLAFPAYGIHEKMAGFLFANTLIK